MDTTIHLPQCADFFSNFNQLKHVLDSLQILDTSYSRCFDSFNMLFVQKYLHLWHVEF